MTIFEYAGSLAVLSRWTAGKATKDQANAAWDLLTKHGYTTSQTPSRKNWPSQVIRPPSKEDENPGTWGSWKHVVGAVVPIGFLAFLIGDEEFRGEVEVAVKEGAKAVTGGFLGFLPWVGLGVGAYLYVQNRKK